MSWLWGLRLQTRNRGGITLVLWLTEMVSRQRSWKVWSLPSFPQVILIFLKISSEFWTNGWKLLSSQVLPGPTSPRRVPRWRLPTSSPKWRWYHRKLSRRLPLNKAWELPPSKSKVGYDDETSVDVIFIVFSSSFGSFGNFFIAC